MSNSIAIGVAYQDQDITGGSLNNSPIGATTPSTIVGTTVYCTSEIGYTAAAQGTVTQATSKSTGVTLSKSAGRITMNNAELAANTAVSFTLTNTVISANDAIIVNISGGATAAAYTVYISSMTAGSAVVTLRNMTAGALSEAVVINFAILHGAA
jgi:hypothetical protein